MVNEPTDENERTYKHMKKFVKKQVNIAKKKIYYASCVKKHASNSKLQRQMINQILNKKSKNKIIRNAAAFLFTFVDGRYWAALSLSFRQISIRCYLRTPGYYVN